MTVYRDLGDPDEDRAQWRPGSLALHHPGEALKGTAVTRDARADALSAGFSDALIGNHDRHPGQFRWDSGAGRLGLIDHSFSFPVEGALCRGAYFQAFRRREQAKLDEHERESLRALLDDPDLFGLAGVLERDRVERLRWRARRMLDLDVVLLKGVA